MRRPVASTAAALLVTLSTAAPAAAGTRYTVGWGDTLTGIAAAHDVSVDALARANDLDPAGVLVAGTTVRIPAPAGAFAGRYTVRWGDTLSGIADRHGVTVRRLARANRLDAARVLPAGIVLRVPGGALAAGGRAGEASYVVVRGDTLSGIAARAGTSVSVLAALNGLDPDGILLEGATLRLPGAGSAGDAAIGATVAQPWAVRASIDHWSAHYGLDPRLVRALAWMESGLQADVTSSAGAWGVMQIMPDTWDFAETVLIGAPVPRTADGNVRVGVAYLHHLLHRFGGDERLALAAYYQGAEAVRRHGLLAMTVPYVADVLALRDRM